MFAAFYLIPVFATPQIAPSRVLPARPVEALLFSREVESLLESSCGDVDGGAVSEESSGAIEFDELRASMEALQGRLEEFENLLEEQRSEVSPLEWEVSATLLLQSLNGTDQDTAFATGSFDIVLESPLWEGAVGVVDLESVGGDGPDSVIGTMAGWNGDAGSGQSADGVDRMGVLEAFISTPISSAEYVLTFGKVDLGGFFDANALANDETAQFVSGAFVNSAAFEAPDPSAGVVMSYLPAASYDFNMAVSSADNDGNEVFDDVFATAQLAWFRGEGEYRVYGWMDGSRDDLPGMGVSLSQGVSESLQVFARCAWQGEEAVAPDAMQRAWSAGCQVDGVLPHCVLGFAYGECTARDSALETESTWETYCSRELNPHLVTSLHLAGASSPGGSPTEGSATVLSLRLQFSF